MSVYHSNKQWTTYRILDATVDNPDLADPLNVGATGAAEGKGFILWGDTSAAKIEWNEDSDQLLTTSATIRMGTDDKLEFRSASHYIHSDAANDLMINAGTNLNLAIGDTDVIAIAAASVTINQDTILAAGKSLGLSGAGYFQAFYMNIYAFRANDGTASFSIADITGIPTFATAVVMESTLGVTGVATFTAAVVPAVSGTPALGSASLMWSGLFLKSGAVINFDNGDVTLTHSADALTISGADKFQFRNTSTFIYSDADGKLTIQALRTAADNIKIEGHLQMGGNIRMHSDRKIEFRDADVFIYSGIDGKLTLQVDNAESSAIHLATGAGGGVSLSGYLLLAHKTSAPAAPADGVIWYNAVADQFKGRANGATVSFVMSTYDGDVTLVGSHKLYLRDTGLYISSVSANKMRIQANVSAADAIQIEGHVQMGGNIRMHSDRKIEFRDADVFIYSGIDGKLTLQVDNAESSAIHLATGAGGGVSLSGYLLLAHKTSAPAAPADGVIWYDAVADEFKGRKAGATVNISTS